jgi:hypothetical protein
MANNIFLKKNIIIVTYWIDSDQPKLSCKILWCGVWDCDKIIESILKQIRKPNQIFEGQF